jgi:hypothetical protein
MRELYLGGDPKLFETRNSLIFHLIFHLISSYCPRPSKIRGKIRDSEAGVAG